MVIRHALLALSGIWLAQPFEQLQAQFQDLGFESANIVPIPGDFYGRIQLGAAFPGWTGTVGGIQQSNALYNNYFLDSSGIGIVDANDTFFHGLIQGRYAAVLQAGWLLNQEGQSANTSIYQTGNIASDERSLRFDARVLGGGFGVTINGQTLSLVPLQSGGNFTLFGADITQWAGQSSVTLAFTAFAENPHVGNTYLFLDGVQFSTEAIPEPGTSGLFTFRVLLISVRLSRSRESA